MSVTVKDVRSIYDKAYAHPGLMGTHLDREYSRVTKTSLLGLCTGAPNPRLLDLGTGDGDLWEFAGAHWKKHAVDISQTGTRRAAMRFPTLRAAVSIAENLPYPDDFFGAVVAADTIEHVFSLEQSLQEVRRVLRPGGKFALSVPAPDSLRKWAANRLLRQVPSLKMLGQLLWVVARRQMLFGQAAFQPIDRDLSMKDWRALLHRAGFTITRTVEWPQSPLTPIVYLIGTEVGPT